MHSASFFCSCLLLRDSSDVIVARELSRHPRLIRPLVDQVLAYKTLFALVLFSALALVGSLTLAPADSRILALYGTMLFTTAIGLDFVFRGTERMGLVALSLCVRTGIYAFGVLVLVRDASRIAWVPIWLTVGELTGIAPGLAQLLEALSAAATAVEPAFLACPGAARADGLFDSAFAGRDQHGGSAGRRLPECFERGWPVRGAAPDGHGTLDVRPDHAASGVSDALAVVAPEGGGRARGARFAGRGLDDGAGAGGGGLHGPGRSPRSPVPAARLRGAGFLLALGIWRAPLLILAYLYQITLIALNRETVGVRTLVAGALAIVPAGRRAAVDVRAAGGGVGRVAGRAGPGPGGLRMPGPGRAAARLASSPGAAGAGIAGDGAGLPGAQASSCSAGRTRRRADLRRRLAGAGGLASDRVVGPRVPARGTLHARPRD